MPGESCTITLGCCTYLCETSGLLGHVPVSCNVSWAFVSFLCSFVEILLVCLVSKERLSCYDCDLTLVSSLCLKHDKETIKEHKMVWRTFWQHSVALSRWQCALLRDCACWHSEEAADPGFQIQGFPFCQLTILEEDYQDGVLRLQCHADLGRPGEVQGFLQEGGHFTGVCPSPRVLRCTDRKGHTSSEAGCCCLEELDSNRSVADCFGAGELSVLWEWKLARQCLWQFCCVWWKLWIVPNYKHASTSSHPEPCRGL